jgi:beta-phosphoglucomutase
MLKAVLFDLDGVLVDSEKIYFRSVRDTFREFGVEISENEYVRRWMIEQTTTPGAIKDYRLNVTLEEVRVLKEKFVEEYVQDMQMIPGALDLLQRFHGKYPLGLVSSASRKEVLRKTSRFDLMKFFDISVCEGDVKNRKPHPEPYIRGCQLLGISPKYTLVIEDNPSGNQSGKAAGCKTIVRPDGFTKHMDFSLADIVIKEFSEINDELIKRLFGN